MSCSTNWAKSAYINIIQKKLISSIINKKQKYKSKCNSDCQNANEKACTFKGQTILSWCDNMVLTDASFRECSPEYPAYKRSCDQKLKWQCHDAVSWNICDPDQKKWTEISALEASFKSTIEGHDQNHRNYHGTWHGNDLLRCGTFRFYKKTECKFFAGPEITNQSMHIAKIQAIGNPIQASLIVSMFSIPIWRVTL